MDWLAKALWLILWAGLCRNKDGCLVEEGGNCTFTCSGRFHGNESYIWWTASQASGEIVVSSFNLETQTFVNYYHDQYEARLSYTGQEYEYRSQLRMFNITPAQRRLVIKCIQMDEAKQPPHIEETYSLSLYHIPESVWCQTSSVNGKEIQVICHIPQVYPGVQCLIYHESESTQPTTMISFNSSELTDGTIYYSANCSAILTVSQSGMPRFRIQVCPDVTGYIDRMCVNATLNSSRPQTGRAEIEKVKPQQSEEESTESRKTGQKEDERSTEETEKEGRGRYNWKETDYISTEMSHTNRSIKDEQTNQAGNETLQVPFVIIYVVAGFVAGIGIVFLLRRARVWYRQRRLKNNDRYDIIYHTSKTNDLGDSNHHYENIDDFDSSSRPHRHSPQVVKHNTGFLFGSDNGGSVYIQTRDPSAPRPMHSGFDTNYFHSRSSLSSNEYTAVSDHDWSLPDTDDVSAGHEDDHHYIRPSTPPLYEQNNHHHIPAPRPVYINA